MVSRTLISLLAVILNIAIVVRANHIDFEGCREAGFDPDQLACTTCRLLPESVLEQCQSCCFSYKTIEKRTKRYQAAVIAHPLGGMSYYPEIDNMLQEDWTGLVELKGNKRLILKDTTGEPRPSALYWFHDIPKTSLSVYDLSQTADETVFLEGWKRDDVREMLKAIIPDS